MKTFSLMLIPLSLLYVLMFFLWEPLYMFSMDKRYFDAAKTIVLYDKYAHSSWIMMLNRTCMVREFRMRNSLYWCKKFESCRSTI